MLEGLDEGLPRLLKAAGPDCHVMVLAIHGMNEQREYEALGAQVARLFAGRQPQDWHEHPDLIRRVRDLVPDSLHRAVWRRLPYAWREARQNQIGTSNSDLQHDKLFPVVHEIHSGVRVNLAGRERDGFVQEAEIAGLLDALETYVKDFRTEAGERAFTGVWRTAQEEPGSRSHRLPDALILANTELTGATRMIGPGGVTVASHREEARNGIHDGRGFCYFRPAGGKSASRDSIDNLDFAPSILSLLGVEPQRQYSGRSFIA